MDDFVKEFIKEILKCKYMVITIKLNEYFYRIYNNFIRTNFNFK